MGSMGFDDMILSKYTSIEKINHGHTPGNSSDIVDGAPAVLISSEQAGKDLGLTPHGRLVSTVLDELERRNFKRAMLSLCVGGGMGISTVNERL